MDFYCAVLSYFFPWDITIAATTNGRISSWLGTVAEASQCDWIPGRAANAHPPCFLGHASNDNQCNAAMSGHQMYFQRSHRSAAAVEHGSTPFLALIAIRSRIIERCLTHHIFAMPLVDARMVEAQRQWWGLCFLKVIIGTAAHVYETRYICWACRVSWVAKRALFNYYIPIFHSVSF